MAALNSSTFILSLQNFALVLTVIYVKICTSNFFHDCVNILKYYGMLKLSSHINERENIKVKWAIGLINYTQMTNIFPSMYRIASFHNNYCT